MDDSSIRLTSKIGDKREEVADCKEKYNASKIKESFENELTSLINMHSVENESNTPDFILAQYIKGCLKSFARAVQQCETWHGRDPRPSHTRYGKELG